MQPVRWGILGAAKFAREHMGPAIHAAEGAEFVALATTSPEKAARFQAFAPGIRVHDSYGALLADPGIDAVYIPLPNHLHVEWSLRALEAGKPVLCEKPMTLQADEFDRLIDIRDRTGLLAAEAYMICHHPQWHLARRLVADGQIGALVHVGGRFTFDNRSDTQNIRNRAETGGGALRDIGVYVIGAARYVSGVEPDQVAARIRWENRIDAFAEVTARLEQATYSAYVSIRAHPYQEMVFHGETGVIRMPTPFNARVYGEARVELHKPGLAVETWRFPGADHYRLQVEAFGRSLREGADYPVPLEFSRGTQVVIDKALERASPL